MNVSLVRRALEGAREAALCNADATAACVQVSLDDAEKLIQCLMQLEELLRALHSVGVAA